MACPSSATTQLENLHPSLPTDTRICIVGGGPSGLSAAYALVRLGYHKVTVLEQNECVSGMCETVEIEGFSYDLGGQVVAKDSAPTIMALASEMRLEMEDMSNHKLAMIDCKRKSSQDLDVAKDYISIMPLTLQLQVQAEGSDRIGVHAVAHLAHENSPIYLEKSLVNKEGSCKLTRVPLSVAAGYTASGYGFVEDMPYAYLHEFTRTSMLGKIRRFKNGYATLWKSLAARLPDVQINSQVVGIERDNKRGTITIQVAQNAPELLSKQTYKEQEFDKVIISGTSVFKSMCGIYRSPPCPDSSTSEHKVKHIMCLTTKEEEIFSKVKTIDYYTTVLKISGLDLPQGFYYCKEYVEDPSTIGHPVAIQRFHSETDVYLFWSYGTEAITKEVVLQLLYEDVTSMGGIVKEFLLQRRWNYFPHVCSQEMEDGFFDKLEEMQGVNNTFYVGALMAFELTERNAAYSVNLMAKHFATTSENMKYVKKMFELPLVVEDKPYLTEDLSELSGVEEFPNLSTIDAYLQFWAKHSVVGNRILYTWLNDDGNEGEKLTYTELDNCATKVARDLLTTIKPGECVILIHPPGLEFIIAFFACIRARILPVPLIPPDPMQHMGQALAKIEKVAQVTNAKAFLSTSTYHTAVNLEAFKNSFSRRGSGPTWPDLPWIHTDNQNTRQNIGLLTRVFSKRKIFVPPKQNWSEKGKSPVSPNSLHKPSNMSPTKTRDSGGIMENKYATSIKSITDSGPTIIENEFESPKPENICFLQFTSGSTGEPKGVIINHGGLMHNVKLMRSSYKSTSKTVLVSWLPQYHDMGLIGGLLTAMVSGGMAVLFSPMAFIRRPMLWLDTISKYKATHTAGPNFAFELIVRRYNKDQSSGKHSCTLDLSSLRFMMVSAEPIRSKTIKSFIETLHKFGLKEQVIAPGYGLAENCVFVSCAWGGQQPIWTDWQGRVCCGYVKHREDMDIRIVRQDTCEEATEGEEGEVWISSPSSGSGYWGRPQESTQTFQNILKSCSGQRHYIKTGDLGRIMEGKLFITGRIKDLIIVQGRNIYPADIEKTVEDCCPLIRPGCCAVLGAPQETLESMGIPSTYSSDGVGVIVVAEIRDACIVDTEVLASIKSVIADEHGLEIACITLIKPRTICKTSSGKIRRFECMKQFVGGQLQVISDSVSQSCPSSPFASTSKNNKHTVSRSLSFGTFASSLSRVPFSPASTSPPSVRTSLSPLNSPEMMSKEKNQNQYCKQRTQPASGTQNVRLSWPSEKETERFLIDLIAEKTKLPRGKISVTEPLTSYGISSVGVVHAAQKLSAFLGTQVAAIDIYTYSSISELVTFTKSLMQHSFPDEKRNLSTENGTLSQLKASVDQVEELEVDIMAGSDMKSARNPSAARCIIITFLQMMGIMYTAAILLLPAVVVSCMAIKLAKSSIAAWLTMAIFLLPIAHIAYIVIVGLTISLVAVPFLQPNYARDPCLLLWTPGFVKWWTLYRLQDFTTDKIACSLRGTIFMAWWYRAMGAQVGKNVLLDTTEIIEPALLRIGNGATIAEGACIQAHEVSPGVVRFRPIFVGHTAWMGPYSHASMAAQIPPKGKILPLHVYKKDSTYEFEMQETNLQSNDNRTISLLVTCQQLLGLYLVSMISAVSAVLAYPAFLWLCTTLIQLPLDSVLHVSSIDLKTATLFLSIAAIFPWHVAILTPLIAYIDSLENLFQALVELANHGKASSLAICFIGSYITYGVLLCTLTCTMKWCLIGKLKPKEDEVSLSSSLGFRIWLVHRLITAAHDKFTVFLSGTEAFCVYLRCMGSKVGYMSSIRSVNPLIDPDLLHLQRQCHLGDFAKIVTSMPKQSGGTSYSQISIGAHSVVGAQSVVLPGATIQKQVVLGAMSVAAEKSILKEGGIYVGIHNTLMINQYPPAQQGTKQIDDQNLQSSYKKLIATLAAHIASTTVKVQARYFHRVGVAGKGTMKVLNSLPKGFPQHDIFTPGKTFQVILRHSNSLSSDDDARGDARGAALRIITSQHDDNLDDALLDLTLKSGKAFYARTIADFSSWLMGSREQRIESVKRNPRMGAAVWMSLRRPNSYGELHYYSNTCCILRAADHQHKEYYVRFCLRPDDPLYNEDEGSVQAEDILPPDTGMLPRNPNDKRPPLFLANDFRKRLLTIEGVRYVLQMQLRPVADVPQQNEVALDCTLPWDEKLYPFQDVALLHLNEVLDNEAAENLRFDPMKKTPSLDMIHATSQFESASIDHGRCLAYVVAQHLRNGLPLKDEWKHMLSEVAIGKQVLHQYKSEDIMQIRGCPALSGTAAHVDNSAESEMIIKLSKCMKSNDSDNKSDHNMNMKDPAWTNRVINNIKEEHQANKKKENDFSEFIKLRFIRGIQPLLQTVVPMLILTVSIYPSVLLLSYVGSRSGKKAMVALLPVAYIVFGLLMSVFSILSRWVLVGCTRAGDTSELWGLRSLCDTTWQAIHALLCKCFLELTKGSLFCVIYFNCLGASISMGGVYMDTLHALNPDLLQIGPGCCIGRNVLLFGHLYEGGRVAFKKIELGEGSCVGTRALLLPGLRMEAGAHLDPLALGLKDEVIASYV
ncbi:hypothetical protein L7F22_028192 [Adiantum nelumboides]|nr:hypothetical protein [Adiantum nelumboides]